MPNWHLSSFGEKIFQCQLCGPSQNRAKLRIYTACAHEHVVQNTLKMHQKHEKMSSRAENWSVNLFLSVSDEDVRKKKFRVFSRILEEIFEIFQNFHLQRGPCASNFVVKIEGPNNAQKLDSEWLFSWNRKRLVYLPILNTQIIFCKVVMPHFDQQRIRVYIL